MSTSSTTTPFSPFSMRVNVHRERENERIVGSLFPRDMRERVEGKKDDQ